MEISPAESTNLPVIIKRLKEYYLNGSNVIKQSNDQGFLNVSLIRLVPMKGQKKRERGSLSIFDRSLEFSSIS